MNGCQGEQAEQKKKNGSLLLSIEYVFINFAGAHRTTYQP